MNIKTISSLLVLPLVLSLLACMQNTTVKNEDGLRQDSLMENSPTEDQKYCFVHTDGTDHQDSTFVRLTFNGDLVEGTYNWFPYEKDSRQGTLKGKKSGDTLDVIWKYMQEGLQDTLRTRFILKEGILIQQPFTINGENGRQVLDKDAPFNIEYDKIDCAE